MSVTMQSQKPVENEKKRKEILSNCRSKELWISFTKKDRQKFRQTFKGLLLSLQTQREFLQWLPEIAYTENTSISTILDSKEIQQVLQSPKLNNPQKIKHIRKILYARRFPRLNAALSKWKSIAAAYNPDPQRVVFEHSIGFEKDSLKIHIELNHPQQAQRIFSALADISPATWETLFWPYKQNCNSIKGISHF